MKMLGLMLCMLGICFGLTALSIASIFVLTSPDGLPCHSVSYDGTLDLKNGFSGKKAFFLNNGIPVPLHGNSILLARGAGRHPGPFPMAMFDALASGTPTYQEFCGRAIVKVKLSDHEVFKLTQKAADDKRRKGILYW